MKNNIEGKSSHLHHDNGSTTLLGDGEVNTSKPNQVKQFRQTIRNRAEIGFFFLNFPYIFFNNVSSVVHRISSK